MQLQPVVGCKTKFHATLDFFLHLVKKTPRRKTSWVRHRISPCLASGLSPPFRRDCSRAGCPPEGPTFLLVIGNAPFKSFGFGVRGYPLKKFAKPGPGGLGGTNCHWQGKGELARRQTSTTITGVKSCWTRLEKSQRRRLRSRRTLYTRVSTLTLERTSVGQLPESASPKETCQPKKVDTRRAGSARTNRQVHRTTASANILAEFPHPKLENRKTPQQVVGVSGGGGNYFAITLNFRCGERPETISLCALLLVNKMSLCSCP